MRIGSPDQEIRRSSLLSRLALPEAKLVLLIAPAGFGKSTLARQLLENSSQGGRCDFKNVTSPLDMVRQLLPALAQEEPERSDMLARYELMLSDSKSAPADHLASAIEQWAAPVAKSTMVFENLERVAANPEMLDFLSGLLRERPSGRLVVICSRVPLGLHLSRFALPHEIITLRAGDLALNADEIAKVLGPFLTGRDLIDRVLHFSRGWPIAVFLLKRFAVEHRLTDLLDNSADVAFAELHDYLIEEALSSVSAQLLEAISWCAYLPDMAESDLRLLLLPGQVDALVTYARSSPFISLNEDGVFELHPLLGSLLLQGSREKRIAVLTQLADAHAKNREFQRAAEVHLALGDQVSAAAMLARHEVVRDRVPSMRYAKVLGSLEHRYVQYHPRLWAMTAMSRMLTTSTSSLLEEGEALWRTMPVSTTPFERFYALFFRVLFMAYLGMTQDAIAEVDRFAKEIGMGQEPCNDLEGSVFFISGLLRAQAGMLNDAERSLTLALPYVAHGEAMHSTLLMILGTDIALPRGDFPMARHFTERALEEARTLGYPNFLAMNLAEAVLGAWFRGDDAAFTRLGLELSEVVEANNILALRYFAAAIRGKDAEPKEADLPKWVAYGRMLAASRAPEPAQSRQSTAAAVLAAAQSGSPFVLTLAYVSQAAFNPSRCAEFMARAGETAEKTQSQALQDAIQDIAAQHSDGMLGPFLKRLRPAGAEPSEKIEVQLATGRVKRGSSEVILPESELALLFVLATHRGFISRVVLAGMLRPDAEEFAACNALSVTLHRLRQRFGTSRVIIGTKDGYALHESVLEFSDHGYTSIP